MNFPSCLATPIIGIQTVRFSMYNGYALEPGPSRELLAIHTPFGLLEPTRMVFGEMNAGTVACAATAPPLSSAPYPTMLTFGPLPTLTITPKVRTLSSTSLRATRTS
jgi:hypothetical protein